MEAAKKIRCLIHADRYLTQSEKEYIPLWEQKNLARKIWAFFYNLPRSIPGPWDEFLYIQDDAKRIKDIIRLMNVFEEEKSMSTYIQDRMDFLSSVQLNIKKGKNYFWNWLVTKFVGLARKKSASKKKKFVIPQEPAHRCPFLISCSRRICMKNTQLPVLTKEYQRQAAGMIRQYADKLIQMGYGSPAGHSKK